MSDEKQLASTSSDKPNVTRRAVRDLIFDVLLGDWRRAEQYGEPFDQDSIKRSQVADEKLRELGAAAALHLLELAKTDPDENIRYTAVEYMRQLPGAAVPPEDPPPTPTISVAPKTGEGTPPPPDPETRTIEAARDTVIAAFRQSPDPAARAAVEADAAAYLPAMLRARQSLMDYRATAAMDTFIEGLHPDDVEGALLALLDDPEARVRRQAVVYCGFFKLEAAVEPLLALLEDITTPDEDDDDEATPEPQAVASILYALGRIGDARAFDAVMSFTDDDAAEIKRAALSAVGKFGDVRAVDVVLPYMNTRDRALRSAMVVSLGGLMADARARDALASLANDPSKPIRTSAATVIARNAAAADPSVDLLIELVTSPDHDVQRAALDALSENTAVHGDVRLHDTLVAQIEASSPAGLTLYARAIVPFASTETLAALRSAQSSIPDSRVYNNIRGELGHIIRMVEARVGG